MRTSDHIGLNFLGVLRHFKNAGRHRIFHCDSRTVCIQELQEEFLCFKSLLVPFHVDLPLLGIQSASTSVGKVCTRWEGNDHVPLAFNRVLLSVHAHEFTITIKQRQHILRDVPFRMTTGTFNDVTGISFMTKFSQFHGHSLGFLTGNQDIHSTTTSLL